MAYQVLARKFRPHSFDDVVGQSHVTRTLRNAIRMGRIHHAFLFTGTRGCGKTSTARILAKALNCTQAGKDLDPCNECDSCKEITGGASLDVLEIDGASNNGVDAIRELRENVRFMPSKGRFKIYIVDEVHMLSNAAFNALLKTLEEPPAHVIFIFATTEPHSLPQTILSRCQRFDFKRIPPKRIAERVAQIAEAEGVEITPVGLASLARAAEGSMRDAQSLFDQVISFAGKDDAAKKTKVTDEQIVESLGLIDRRLFSDLMAALAARDGKAAIDVGARVATAGYDVANFAREMLARIRDLMIVKVVAEPAALVDLSAEELAQLKEQAGAFTREEIDALFLMLESALEEMTRGGAPQLALEMALLRMAAVEPIAPIAELASRLEALAGGETPAKGAAPASGFKGWRPPDERAPRQVSLGAGGSAGSSASIPPQSHRPSSIPAQSPPVSAKASTHAAVPAAAPRPPSSREPRDEEADGGSPEVTAPERTVTATIEAPVFDWANFLGYVRNRKSLLGVLLAEGSLARFDGDRLEIAYDTHGIRAEQIRDKDNVEQITNLARDFMRRPVSVKIVPKSAVERTVPEAQAYRAPGSDAPPPPRRNTVEERAKLREEALGTDAIKDAMDVLGAELAEVRPLKND